MPGHRYFGAGGVGVAVARADGPCCANTFKLPSVPSRASGPGGTLTPRRPDFRSHPGVIQLGSNAARARARMNRDFRGRGRGRLRARFAGPKLHHTPRVRTPLIRPPFVKKDAPFSQMDAPFALRKAPSVSNGGSISTDATSIHTHASSRSAHPGSMSTPASSRSADGSPRRHPFQPPMISSMEIPSTVASDPTSLLPIARRRASTNLRKFLNPSKTDKNADHKARDKPTLLSTIQSLGLCSVT